MQDHDWNDLRYALALSRAGTYRAAGRQTGQSETTVARRIRALERVLGARLFHRAASGQCVPTDAGLVLLAQAERIEQHNIALREGLGQMREALSGTVRISSVPVVVDRILVPALGRLQRDHPGLIVELVPEARNLDLTRREADIAIRLARPAQGGLGTRARRIGAMGFAVYGPAATAPGDAGALPWIGYDAAHGALPQARWLAAAMAQDAGGPGGLRVSDVQTALEAVACGLGRTVLPVAVAAPDPRLQRLPVHEGQEPPGRDVWLLSHVDQRERASVAAAKAWIDGLDWSGPD